MGPKSVSDKLNCQNEEKTYIGNNADLVRWTHSIMTVFIVDLIVEIAKVLNCTFDIGII